MDRCCRRDGCDAQLSDDDPRKGRYANLCAAHRAEAGAAVADSRPRPKRMTSGPREDSFEARALHLAAIGKRLDTTLDELGHLNSARIETARIAREALEAWQAACRQLATTPVGRVP